MIAACALVEGDTVLHQRGLHRPPRAKNQIVLVTDEKKRRSRLCLHEHLILEEATGTTGWFLELVRGERAVFLARPSALADAIAIALLRPTDGVNNLQKRRLGSGCNITYAEHYIRHQRLAINTVSK
jgi:hypothetical protein